MSTILGKTILDKNRKFHEFYVDWARRSPVSGSEFLGSWIDKWLAAAAALRKEEIANNDELEQRAQGIEAVCDELIHRLNDSEDQKNWEFFADLAIWRVAMELYISGLLNVNIERLEQIADFAGINLRVLEEEVRERFPPEKMNDSRGFFASALGFLFWACVTFGLFATGRAISKLFRFLSDPATVSSEEVLAAAGHAGLAFFGAFFLALIGKAFYKGRSDP